LWLTHMRHSFVDVGTRRCSGRTPPQARGARVDGFRTVRVENYEHVFVFRFGKLSFEVSRDKLGI